MPINEKEGIFLNVIIRQEFREMKAYDNLRSEKRRAEEEVNSYGKEKYFI